MKTTVKLKRVLVFFDENQKYAGRNLGKAILGALRDRGFAGATVVKGASGFGSHGDIHTTSILDLNTSLPVIMYIIDDAAKIEELLPIFDEMISDGLVLVDDVQGYRYSKDN
jgi:uncharacterized protein